jgi:hypothetical protein
VVHSIRELYTDHPTSEMLLIMIGLSSSGINVRVSSKDMPTVDGYKHLAEFQKQVVVVLHARSCPPVGLRHAHKSLREFIRIEGTHTASQFRMNLLIAGGTDANDETLPLA